jgi:hypothetical protein
MSGYNVVFKGIGVENDGNHYGVITYTCFSSKSDFDEKKQRNDFCKDEVIAEGVTDSEAVELVRSTTMAARIHAAVTTCTAQDGTVNLDLLESKINDAVFYHRACQEGGLFTRS